MLMTDPMELLAALQAGLLAVLAWQAQAIQKLAREVGELCGRLKK